MDRFLYVAMSGAKESLRAQTANNNNLANASTTGFRADLSAFQARAVTGAGYASRAYATNSTTGWDQSFGAVLTTGRDLDVAVQGPGWIAVQAKDGSEAYTRAGDLSIDPSGILVNGSGHPVVGSAGPITVPEYTAISVATDGTVSIVPLGQPSTTTADIGRIKLVNPDVKSLQRGADGLFRATGEPPQADASVHMVSGAIEGSNVNTANAMVNMIELSRHFELQVKAMRAAEENGAASAQLLKMG
jgi:flagellar basal-body rod protein FlgF